MVLLLLCIVEVFKPRIRVSLRVVSLALASYPLGADRMTEQNPNCNLR